MRAFVPELHLHRDGVLLVLVDLHPLGPEHTQAESGRRLSGGRRWNYGSCSPGDARGVRLSAVARVLRGVEGSGGPGVVGGQRRGDGRRGGVFKGRRRARQIPP